VQTCDLCEFGVLELLQNCVCVCVCVLFFLCVSRASAKLLFCVVLSSFFFWFSRSFSGKLKHLLVYYFFGEFLISRSQYKGRRRRRRRRSRLICD
jgi:hypothetical protein